VDSVVPVHGMHRQTAARFDGRPDVACMAVQCMLRMQACRHAAVAFAIY